MYKVSDEIYQLKIETKYSELNISRRLLLPSTSSLLKLHKTIIIIFGFKGNLPFGFYKSYEIGDECNEIGDRGNYSKISISKAFDHFNCIEYTYDFCNCWDFKITLEKILKKDTLLSYPCCIDSKGGMILDMGGGEYGYRIIADLCRKKILSRKNGSIDFYLDSETLEDEYKDFDPDAFDINSVNLKLSSILIE